MLLSLAAMLVAGFAMIAHFAAGNTVLQMIVEDEMRGRVMSFFAMAFMGMTPFGSLLAGYLADRVGPGWAVAFCGICSMLASAWFARKLPVLRALIRPIYVRKGIISEVASGIENATRLTAVED
jgi:MFS family permease